jgi:hypothetical protein
MTAGTALALAEDEGAASTLVALLNPKTKNARSINFSVLFLFICFTKYFSYRNFKIGINFKIKYLKKQ